jgi:nitrogen-specific signal transduction histidine kinase
LSQMTAYDIKPYSREEFEAMIEPLRRKEKSLLIYKTEHIRKDKTKYPVEVRLQLMEQENPPIFVAIIQDITERKLAEEELLKTHQQLLHSEKLNAAGKLSASFAHEFNNPLTGVRSALEQIRERVPMKDDYKELLTVGIKESITAHLVWDKKTFPFPITPLDIPLSTTFSRLFPLLSPSHTK